MGPVEGGLPVLADGLRGAQVHGCGRMQSDAGMAVFVVVGGEKAVAESAGVLEAVPN